MMAALSTFFRSHSCVASLAIAFMCYNVLQIRTLTLMWQRNCYDQSMRSVTVVASGDNNISSSEATIWTPTQQNGIASSSSPRNRRRRVLIIATVPKDARRVATLWTELECFTIDVHKVIVTAPIERQDKVAKICNAAKTTIPHFADGTVELEARYFVNDRYDVGLWCDALDQISGDDSYDEYGLLNDSVFALRQHSKVFDALQSRNLDLSSMSYSYSAKYFQEYGPEHFWVESVYRGMNQNGLQTFQNYSCVPREHPFFCANDTSDERRKACIINNFEHDLAAQYAKRKMGGNKTVSERVGGLFLADAPSSLIFNKHSGKTWATNLAYWKTLTEDEGFPMVKSKRTNIIPDSDTDTTQLVANPLLQKCTQYITPAVFEALIR